MARAAQLRAEPFCEFVDDTGARCDRLADSVHHKTPIEHGGSKRDPENLASLCRPHHSVIHAELKLDKR